MKQDFRSCSCLWCERPFLARRGGSPKRFCSAAHRMAFWSALRRRAERMVAAGVLTVADIRNDDPAACTLLPDDILPAPLSEHREAEDLLNDLATALRALPEVAWLRAVGKLPDALFERLDGWLEARLA
jgi:hypothetical protein